MKNIVFYPSKIGMLEICCSETHLTSIKFITENSEKKKSKPNKLNNLTIVQIDEYLNGKRKIFDLPLAPQGTDFQKKVWNELTKIPYGSTKSYKEIAQNIGNPQAARAIGMANNKNPLPIIIPCHRVIGSNGKLIGYRGGLNIKQNLLNIEKYYRN